MVILRLNIRLILNISDILRDLVSFVQFKNVKNIHRWVLLLVTLQASPPWVFFTFFKLYKLYQIAQRIIFVVSISFLLKYWISPCLGLKTIDNKIKGCCIWIASIYWSWRGSLWLLLVHAVMLLKLIMVPLLSYFLGFLKCQRGHFQFHQIMDKHQKTLNKMVPSLSFIKMKKVDDVLDLLIFRATAFPWLWVFGLQC